MNTDIDLLNEKIVAATATTPALVDDMNSLAALQLEKSTRLSLLEQRGIYLLKFR